MDQHHQYQVTFVRGPPWNQLVDYIKKYPKTILFRSTRRQLQMMRECRLTFMFKSSIILYSPLHKSPLALLALVTHLDLDLVELD